MYILFHSVLPYTKIKPLKTLALIYAFIQEKSKPSLTFNPFEQPGPGWFSLILTSLLATLVPRVFVPLGQRSSNRHKKERRYKKDPFEKYHNTLLCARSTLAGRTYSSLLCYNCTMEFRVRVRPLERSIVCSYTNV